MDETLARELEIHDRLAAQLDPLTMPLREAEPLESALLRVLGDITGKRLLEVGCGDGELTIRLARAGARVTALDLSPGMVEVARKRVELHAKGASADFIAGPAEAVPAGDGTFDLVVGKWILHHTDLGSMTSEVERLLAPGGRAVFIENSGVNPLLAFARNHVVGRFGVRQVGTPDEHPLQKDDYRRFEAKFSRVNLSYPQFDFLRLLDRQVFRFRRPLITKVCNGFDSFVERRVPWLQPYSFRVVVELIP